MTEKASMIGKLLDLAREDPSYLAKLEQLRRSITVMFTDIQGSTAYFEKHGDAAGLLMVHQCNDTLRMIVDTNGGRVIKTIGDGMLAIFEDCGRSIEAAIAMQYSLGDMNALRPESDRVAIRIGIHYAIGIVRTHDVFGDVVNVASRIESVALPRQIVISEAVYDEVHRQDFDIQKMGRFLLKGKKTELTLYEVAWNQARLEGAIGDRHQVGQGTGRSFRLQVLDASGAIEAEHPIVENLTIGRSQGDVKFPSDLMLSPLHARFFIDDGQIFIENVSEKPESIFIRIGGGYTLQNEDTVLMGRQVLRFREIPYAMSAAAEIGATLDDITKELEEPVAELVRFRAGGQAPTRFPLSADEVFFGRVKGTYVFPEDKLMSRLHARVLQRAEDFILEDLGSRNGTFVQVRGATPLSANGSILLGNQLLRVVRS